MNVLNNTIKISVIVGILLVSFSVSYYFVYFLPHQEKIKINEIRQKEAESKQKEENRLSNLDVCLSEAEADYRGLQKANGKGPNLIIPLGLANAIENKYKDARDDCYKKYPHVR
jgi:hypothetical protein